MNILPFNKVHHPQLQLVVWVARISFLTGVCFLLAGTYRELFRVYRWLASPIYSSDGSSWRSYRYSLDLLHTNWQLIAFGVVLVIVSCFLIIRLSKCSDST